MSSSNSSLGKRSELVDAIDDDDDDAVQSVPTLRRSSRLLSSTSTDNSLQGSQYFTPVQKSRLPMLRSAHPILQSSMSDAEPSKSQLALYRPATAQQQQKLPRGRPRKRAGSEAPTFSKMAVVAEAKTPSQSESSTDKKPRSKSRGRSRSAGRKKIGTTPRLPLAAALHVASQQNGERDEKAASNGVSALLNGNGTATVRRSARVAKYGSENGGGVNGALNGTANGHHHGKASAAGPRAKISSFLGTMKEDHPLLGCILPWLICILYVTVIAAIAYHFDAHKKLPILATEFKRSVMHFVLPYWEKIRK